MRVGLIDFDGKITNLALMKLGAYHKERGDTVILNPASPDGIDKAYCSVLFSKNAEKALELANHYRDIEFGGTGVSLCVELLPDIEEMLPDYDLYQVPDIYGRIKGIMTRSKRLEKATTIVNAGIGFTTRGCIRSCGFCVVPQKEGKLRRESEIRDLINPRSNVLVLLDNNLTADPNCIEKLTEIKERGLIVDITQGIDVRTMTPEIAKALSEVKHLRSIHYAWDLMGFERQVMQGIDVLREFVKPWRHLCFTLVGFDTSFKEDMYRIQKLAAMKIDPYVMIYNRREHENNMETKRLHHFARWVNGRVYKVCPDFNQYDKWAADKALYSFA